MIFDRQYSPFIFHFEGQIIIPAESVYAVFEAKQAINADHVAYAQRKVASVRCLHRTSLPIPHAGGTFDPKPLIPILGGLLTFESDWNPAFGAPLIDAMAQADEWGRLDIGCIAAHGHLFLDQLSKSYEFITGGKPATAFLFRLIARPGQTLTVVGDNRPQCPQQIIPGVAAHFTYPIGDEVGDKLVQAAKIKGVTS